MFCRWCEEEHDRDDDFCSSGCKTEYFLMANSENTEPDSLFGKAGSLLGGLLAVVLPLGGLYEGSMGYPEAVLTFILLMYMRRIAGCNILIFLVIGALLYMCDA
jgi:hypothetical protein